MEYWYLLMGAATSLLGVIIHGFIGARIYLGHVYKSDMESLTKSLSLVAWHVFTIFLLVSAVTLFWVAYNPSWRLAVYPLVAVNMLGAILFIVLGLGRHGQLLKMPGAYLMGGTAVLAWLGIS